MVGMESKKKNEILLKKKTSLSKTVIPNPSRDNVAVKLLVQFLFQRISYNVPMCGDRNSVE